MRLLASENFPRAAVEALRAAGHDVLWARTDLPGSEDEVVLERAQAEERLVATFDKDFGELAFRWGLPATSGVALFRFRAADSVDLAKRIFDFHRVVGKLRCHRRVSNPSTAVTASTPGMTAPFGH